MNHGHFFSKKIIQYCLFIICIALSITIFTYRVCLADKNEFSNITVRSADKEIAISWNSNFISNIEEVIITIVGNSNERTYIVNPKSHKFSFRDGEAGSLYRIEIYAKYKNGNLGYKYNFERMFLDYDNLPDIPLININIADDEELGYSIIYAEDMGDDLIGGTIENNEYVNASFTMSQSGKTQIVTKTKIKIRGNTSAVFFQKKGYKITFDKKTDLLGLGNEYADKEWILLAAGTDLKTYIGNYIGLYSGMEWQPKTRFVNLMINGDWKGCYILTEPVKKSTTKINISDDGYIFECDPYWWNENDIYFRTKHQWNYFAITFKYPKIKSADDERIDKLNTYMDEIEQKIIDHDDDLFEYIDADSFASWILAKDILGVTDGAGSNIYYYINEIDDDNWKNNKLKMGPLWDFDSVFGTSDEYSEQRSMHSFYFTYLLANQEFYDLYIDKWKSLKDTLNEDLSNYLDELYEKSGEALEQSWELDNTRHKKVNGKTLKEEIKEDKEWIFERTEWLNKKLLGSEDDCTE